MKNTPLLKKRLNKKTKVFYLEKIPERNEQTSSKNDDKNNTVTKKTSSLTGKPGTDLPKGKCGF